METLVRTVLKLSEADFDGFDSSDDFFFSVFREERIGRAAEPIMFQADNRQILTDICTPKGILFFTALLAHKDCVSITIGKSNEVVIVYSTEGSTRDNYNMLPGCAAKLAKNPSSCGIEEVLSKAFDVESPRFLFGVDTEAALLGALNALVELKEDS